MTSATTGWRPFGDRAREIWAQVCQEGNVDLGAMRLSGSGPRHQVGVKVIIDGSPGAALAVMSQERSTRWRWSIFLPQATVTASPSRFPGNAEQRIVIHRDQLKDSPRMPTPCCRRSVTWSAHLRWNAGLRDRTLTPPRHHGGSCTRRAKPKLSRQPP
jgi:hypothetical protein